MLRRTTPTTAGLCIALFLPLFPCPYIQSFYSVGLKSLLPVCPAHLVMLVLMSDCHLQQQFLAPFLGSWSTLLDPSLHLSAWLLQVAECGPGVHTYLRQTGSCQTSASGHPLYLVHPDWVSLPDFQGHLQPLTQDPGGGAAQWVLAVEGQDLNQLGFQLVQCPAVWPDCPFTPPSACTSRALHASASHVGRTAVPAQVLERGSEQT